MGNSEKKNFGKNKTFVSSAVLGRYVPVHKIDKNKPAESSKTTAPAELYTPKFCVYDGDYLGKNSQISKKDLYGKMRGNFWDFLKLLFFNLPIIEFLFLKIRQAKIRESISTLDNINEDVDKLVNYFEGKTVVNEQKYQKICEELIKANNIQAKIKKEFLDEF